MIDILHRFIVPAAFAVLPEKMRSREAMAMLLAIALQESEAAARRQRPRKKGGTPGPARGFWQFEQIGIQGVLEHRLTKNTLQAALAELVYVSTASPAALHAIVEHNDVVAAVFARLNLWPLRPALPTREQGAEGWQQYLRAWRPGAPHPSTWPANFATAWEIVDGA